MKWELNEINVGDAVRVNMGLYYHYGICTAEDRIVQFGLPEINLNDKEVKVCATNIERFLNGKFAEVLVLNKKELKKRNSIKIIIEKAENSIGETGYNILHNNCEHFMNRCLFNTSTSQEVGDVQNEIFELITVKDIYIAPTTMFLDNKLLPSYAKKELTKVSNESVRNQKISAYGLLKYAVEKSLGTNENFKKFKKLKNGKPVCENYKFSISHSNELIAVAVSKCEVGVDIEEVKPNQNIELLKSSMRAKDEEFQAENLSDVIGIWTKKEAVYKYKGENVFNPKEINHNEINTKTIQFDFNGIEYVLTLATGNINNVKIVKLFE